MIVNFIRLDQGKLIMKTPGILSHSWKNRHWGGLKDHVVADSVMDPLPLVRPPAPQQLPGLPVCPARPCRGKRLGFRHAKG